MVGLIFAIVCLADSYHIIKEGSVGIYYVQGRLQETLAKPGVNWAPPFITEVEEITTRPRTDKLLPDQKCWQHWSKEITSKMLPRLLVRL